MVCLLLCLLQLELLRRARVWDDLDWKYIEVGQRWKAGEVRKQRHFAATCGRIVARCIARQMPDLLIACMCLLRTAGSAS
jgi:hypothetical protein